MRSAERQSKPIVAEMTTTGFFVPLKQVFFETKQFYFRPEAQGLNPDAVEGRKVEEKTNLCAARQQ